MADSKDSETLPADRRNFLKAASCAIGGGVGLLLAAPVVRLVMDPAGRTTVTSPTDPIDAGALDQFVVGGPPRKVEVIAPTVKDAWIASHGVLLGAAWVHRVAADKIEALSAVCPHLGCAVGWDAGQNNFLCPCHDSRFALNGDKLTGPSERGLDPLPVAIKDGRLQLTWVRFKNGGANREPA
jgi:menaquinol-cytochrome c reductase iron-sulfur subunit